MQNDVLKNEIAPWQEKGRWYHAHITPSGIDAALTDKVVNDHCYISGQYFFVDEKYCVVDYMLVFNKYSRTSNGNLVKTWGIQADNKTSIIITNPTGYTTLDLDLYVYLVEVK